MDPPKLLSNFEVYQLLQERSAKLSGKNAGRKQRSKSSAAENVSTVIFETLEYLNKFCTNMDQMNAERIKNFLNLFVASETGEPKYKLTKAEKLQILNAQPQTIIELYPLIEELEARFTDGREEEFLAEILDIFPAVQQENIDAMEE